MAPVVVRRLSILSLLWVTGLFLRLPILIAAPLGPTIQAEMGFSHATLGMLTTLPVLMLGLGALPAALLLARLDARRLLVIALLAAALAGGARGLAPAPVALLLATAAMGLAIAIMQTALPALVGRLCPGFIALASTVYLNGMMMGEFVGAGLTLPWLLPWVDSWRYALLAIALPALPVALALLRPRLEQSPAPRERGATLPDWRDPLVWRYGLLIGATAATFFGLNAYMERLLDARGMASQLDFALLCFNFAQIGASLAMVVAGPVLLRLPGLLSGLVAAHVLGLAALLAVDAGGVIAVAVFLGVVSALQLVALTTLPAVQCSPTRAGALASGMFTIGYGLGFLLPLAAGLAIDLSGDVDTALAILLAFNALCLVGLMRRHPGRA